MVATYEVEAGAEAISIAPEAQLIELEERLARGFRIIEERQAAGMSVIRLEEHWLNLLTSYESLFKSLR